MGAKLKNIKIPIEESNFNFAEQQSTEIETLKFSKQQLVSSNKYAFRRDALNALLDEKQVYTFDEVDKKLHDFLKGKVNE